MGKSMVSGSFFPVNPLIQVSEKKLIEHFLFFHILGMSSSQLTFIFFRGVGKPPTSKQSLLVPEVDFPRGTVGTVADATWLPGGKDCLRRQLSWADHGEGGFPFCSDEVLFFCGELQFASICHLKMDH
jgi:hypothetical protein